MLMVGPRRRFMESNYEDIVEWSKNAIQILRDSEKDSDYKIEISIEAPSLWSESNTYCKVIIWRTIRNNESVHYYWRISNSYNNIKDCINELNIQLQDLIERNKIPEIIERNGKKFKLVEIIE